MHFSNSQSSIENEKNAYDLVQNNTRPLKKITLINSKRINKITEITTPVNNFFYGIDKRNKVVKITRAATEENTHQKKVSSS